MEDAQEMMAGHCQGAYQIVREEQVVVGEQTQANYGESHNRRSTSGSANSTTTNLTEYHVTYQCGGAQPAVAASPAGTMEPQPGTMEPAPQQAETVVQPQY
jgi:hypothetical protein